MKKGFTLVELLATVAILGMLVMLVLPNAFNYFDISMKKDMEVQEKLVADAGVIYNNDYVLYPINQAEDLSCVAYKNDNGAVTETTHKLVTLSTLINKGIIDNIYYKEIKCDIDKSFVVFELNQSNSKYNKNPKAYLKCGDVYTTDGYDRFSNCN